MEPLRASGGTLSEGALVDLWLASVWRRSSSEKTRRRSRGPPVRYRAWLDDRALRSVRLPDAIAYTRHLEGTGLAPSNQAEALAAVRSLYKFMARVGTEAGGADHSPFDAVPTPKVSSQGAPRMLTTTPCWPWRPPRRVRWSCS